MDSKGNDALLKTTRITEWTVNSGGYLAIVFGGFLILGCLSAYVIAVARGNVDAFLPLISDAAGSPPQNGLFGTLVSLGGMTGIVFMFLRYLIVLEKNQENSKLVLVLNKLSLVVGIISMFGITLVTGYPINFYRNRDIWLSDVGIPHMIGGVMLFSFGIVYIAIQCILTLYLKPKENTMLFCRFAICAICTAAFVYHLVTVPDNFGGISMDNYVNGTKDLLEEAIEPFPATMGASLRVPIKTSGSYLSSAVTEWILLFFFCFFFFTFFSETQEYSLLLVIETHGSELDQPNEASFESNGTKKSSRKEPLQPLSATDLAERRTSEVRTLFRRDSTCQTVEEVTPDPKFTSFQDGKYTKMQCSSFELLSGNKLEELIENTMKSKMKNDKSETTNGLP